MNRKTGVVYAALAAILFGASTPAAKPLLGNASPLLVAGLLYLASGLGLAGVRVVARHAMPVETPLRKSDWPSLTGAIVFGGIIGPALLMTGLAHTSAATASLLLNVEAFATAAIALLIFREHASARTILGMLAIVLGALALAWNGKPSTGTVSGPLAIVGACVAWALDNNLTRNIAASDALQIASIKSLVAGAFNTALALVLAHARLPSGGVLAGVAVIGFIGYGLSLVCYIVALRHLGTARTAAYFSAAPFVGAAIAIAAGSAVLDARFAIAAALMATGVLLHATEHHSHEHVHERVEHEHLHVHDEHHRHEHSPADPPGEPHAHVHRHDVLAHAHAHFPDDHHRHAH